METAAITQILRLPAKYSIIDFVVGHLLALGMRLTVLEIAAPLRRPRLVVLALVTNFVLGPVFAYLSARLISLLIPLEHGYMIGLMIIDSAAGTPMLPKWVKLAKGDLGSRDLYHAPWHGGRVRAWLWARRAQGNAPITQCALATRHVARVLQALNGLLERLGHGPLTAAQAGVRRIQAEGPTGQVVLVLHRVCGRLDLNSS